MKEYEEFEKEFKNTTTITALREFLKRLKMEKIKLMSGASPSPNAFAVLDEQLRLVQWELDRLQAMQSKGRFRAFYALLKLLDEHYPFRTPVIQYKYMLDDGVRDLKKEILSNMLHLAPVERVPYLERVQFETEKLFTNVYATEAVLEEWFSKYNTCEKDLFSPEASKHRNLVFRTLTAKQPAVKEAAQVFAGEEEHGTNRLLRRPADIRQRTSAEGRTRPGEDSLRRMAMNAVNDEYDIQNDFYNVFYGRAINEVVDFVKEQVRVYSPQDMRMTKKRSAVNKQADVKLEDLFLDKALYASCLDALRKVTPAVIDENDNYLLGAKKKASVVAWVDVVLKHKIKEVSRQVLAQALNTTLKGLNMGHDGRTLNSKSITEGPAYRDFQRKFNGLSA